VEFAAAIGAVDLKKLFDYSEYHGLFKRSNYFLLDKDTFLVIKTSRSKIKPFYGLARPVYEQFNTLTHEARTYFLVALDSSRSGWVLSKEQLIGQIQSRERSASPRSKISTRSLTTTCGFNIASTRRRHFLARSEDNDDRMGMTTACSRVRCARRLMLSVTPRGNDTDRFHFTG